MITEASIQSALNGLAIVLLYAQIFNPESGDSDRFPLLRALSTSLATKLDNPAAFLKLSSLLYGSVLEYIQTGKVSTGEYDPRDLDINTGYPELLKEIFISINPKELTSGDQFLIRMTLSLIHVRRILRATPLLSTDSITKAVDPGVDDVTKKQIGQALRKLGLESGSVFKALRVHQKAHKLHASSAAGPNGHSL
jgi:hypothetical protein